MTTGMENEADLSQDLERGPDATEPRLSESRMSGIWSAASSSNSSILGEDAAMDGETWGPQHPCYPHLNPHVSLYTPEYASTRIIRVKRDWLIAGDLAPTFSNLYPEILSQAGLPEAEFWSVVDKINSELVPIFNPFGWRNILDGMLGLLSGWIWEDLGLTHTKSRLRNLENWIEQWNQEKQRALGGEMRYPPKIVPLRWTGYMTLDIQITDPDVNPDEPSTPGNDDAVVVPAKSESLKSIPPEATKHISLVGPSKPEPALVA